MPQLTENQRNIIQSATKIIGRGLVFLALLILILIGILFYETYFNYTPLPKASPPSVAKTYAALQENEIIENGIHVETGLIASEGWQIVRQNCLACHSSKLVIQNKATREGWQETIKWMQQTQGLWDLGDKETIILDYLAANYAPEKIGRRKTLEIQEWYFIEN